ncbi:14411_t:CDS:2 [Gigaspora margarita]|uniref:14411_t:CDS:1 n=1 Tax=Gigaspora margarita TaxID=4874 RepID=A0ABM8W5T4_GIGMA|nr:14411_t:CDS:2 [Gigaspora margarita]
MDNNTSNNSSNNNLPPNNIVCSHELSYNTYDSDSSDLSIRTTRSLQEIFIRMSGKRGQTQSKQAAQLSSFHNESHTHHTSHSIEYSRSIECDRSFLPERRSCLPSHGQQPSNQNQPRENYNKTTHINKQRQDIIANKSKHPNISNFELVDWYYWTHIKNKKDIRSNFAAKRQRTVKSSASKYIT